MEKVFTLRNHRWALFVVVARSHSGAIWQIEVFADCQNTNDRAMRVFTYKDERSATIEALKIVGLSQ